jgi:hypothetical protein
MKRHISVLITVAIFILLLAAIWDRVFIHIIIPVAPMPWWLPWVAGVVLFLGVEFAISRLFGGKDRER